ncbi:P-TEFB associated cyclin [Schizosaccharomyces cryophilus OY26]|uniref:p-TEFB associated cyclin n=1 Tax=Schizosaccharomyces cryophilus (strain OY26 / ATCC MYA-4695 / CBS 11777 / NBRC 106824 / NRRL Y48691) TaxID=653667 RepID=S9VZI6_SCHCR|nr:P-TEFB associated cyclin [Schizosaccharomyces cryophilus OY26]EPY51609.1 P-TEFB associated cyclin [Schizosaccharomyces cryophilus OY26]
MKETFSTPEVDWQTSSQWIIKKEDLDYTPSALDGIPLVQEEIQRSKGCNFIINVGLRLKLPQLTLATANAYFHRFYLRFSLKEYHYYDIAATCVFLASKVEDSNRKLRDIIINCAKVAQKNNNILIDEQTKEYWRWRDVILYTEEILLEAICFDFKVDHPFNDLLRLIQHYVPDHKNLTKISWTYINDSTRSISCLLFPRKVIAAAAFQYGLEKTKTSLPLNEAGTPSWLIENNISMDDIHAVMNLIHSLYRQINSGKPVPQGEVKSDSQMPSQSSTPSTMAASSAQSTPQVEPAITKLSFETGQKAPPSQADSLNTPQSGQIEQEQRAAEADKKEETQGVMETS